MEPEKVETPRTRGKPVQFTLGPFTYTRDQHGNWSRNRLNPGIGFKTVALDHDAVFLAEELAKHMEPV